MRRAAVSVNANIVEGTKRRTLPDRRHFHVIAEASLEELKYYFILSRDLKFITAADSETLLQAAREVGRLLHGFTQSLTYKPTLQQRV